MPPKKKAGGKKKKKATPALVKEVALVLPPITTSNTSSLLHAVSSSNVESVGRLVAHYNFAPTLKATDSSGTGPLHVASKGGDATMLTKLLSYPETTQTINSCEAASIGGYGAIHYACAGNYPQVLTLLLRHGADMNLKTRSNLQDSPLHICCKVGPITSPCAKILIAAGCDINIVDSFGHNCSYWASTRGHTSMITELALPSAHAASCEEYIKMMLSKPGFSFKQPKPKAKAAAKGKGKK